MKIKKRKIGTRQTTCRAGPRPNGFIRAGAKLLARLNDVVGQVG